MSSEGLEYTLYSYWRSSCSWRVRIVLALKGIKYNYVPVPLLKKAQTSEGYTEKNPMQEVPTLVVSQPGKPDIVLTQSIAIMEYLDFVKPHPTIYATYDHVVRAQVMALALDIAAGIQPVQNLKILQNVEALAGAQAKADWGKQWIERGLTALEAKIASSTTKFMLTDFPTIAEACLVPQLYNARRFNVDMSKFPRLLAVEAACEDLEAFKAAHPDAQPDANQV